MDELTAEMFSNTQVFYKDGKEIAKWSYNDNGTIKKEGKKISGTVRMYHRNKMLASEMTYKNGDLNGRYLLLSEKGQVEEEGSFRENGLHGPYRQFYENGNLKLEGFYNKGKRNGLFRMYYESGIVLEEETYANSLLEGYVREYYVDGVLETEGFYKKGRLTRLKQFGPDGMLKLEEKYK